MQWQSEAGGPGVIFTSIVPTWLQGKQRFGVRDRDQGIKFQKLPKMTQILDPFLTPSQHRLGD